MNDHADAVLVAAVAKPRDHLRRRAEVFLRRHEPVVPFNVGIELLFVARKHNLSCRTFLTAAGKRFDIEGLDTLLAAAAALDKGQIQSVFDAVHAARALVDGVHLVTTDKALQASGFPTVSF